MMKKLFCLVLCAALLCTVLPGMAQSLPYDLLDEAVEANEQCANSDDQLAVAALYLRKLCAYVAHELDVNGQMTELLDQLIEQAEQDSARCTTASARTANDLYATADLLSVMTTFLDDSTHRADILAAQQKLNAFCLTIQDQHAAAAEAIFQLTAILAQQLDVTGAWSDQIAAVQSDYAASQERCRGSLHRTANSFYRTASMLSIMTLMLDRRGGWAESVDSVQELLSNLDSQCISAFQQCVNGSYRCMELMAVLALELE